MKSPYVCAVCGQGIQIGRHSSGWRHASSARSDHQVIKVSREGYVGPVRHQPRTQHSALIAELKGIAEVFSILHDGVIVAADPQGPDLVLSVECQYLAERVAPNWTRFSIRLVQVDNLRFYAWADDLSADPWVLTDPGLIFASEPGILHGAIKETELEIVLVDPNPGTGYCGGECRLLVSGAIVWDQAGREIGLPELRRIYDEYWTDWGTRTT